MCRGCRAEDVTRESGKIEAPSVSRCNKIDYNTAAHRAKHGRHGRFQELLKNAHGERANSTLSAFPTQPRRFRRKETPVFASGNGKERQSSGNSRNCERAVATPRVAAFAPLPTHRPRGKRTRTILLYMNPRFRLREGRGHSRRISCVQTWAHRALPSNGSLDGRPRFPRFFNAN